MIIHTLRLLSLLAIAGLISSCSDTSTHSNEQELPPNIIFFIPDDVGIEQMQSFGCGGASPPQLPNITAIASAGVNFRNLWAMPEYSPSRALVFEGRYPLRTNVLDAILSVDLANSQVSPNGSMR
jgi:arylsulfatase A-like enzyme